MRLTFLFPVAAILVFGACGTEKIVSRNNGPAIPDPDRNFDRPPETVGVDAGDGEILEPGFEDDFCGPRTVDEPYEPAPGELILVDQETSSKWNVLGQAFEGPCRGASLEAVPSFVGMWFAWSGTRPGGLIWPDGTNDQPGPQPDGGECLVQCNDILSGGPPPDGIPALDHEGRWDRPKPAAMIPVDEVDYVAETDRVLGVIVDGEARAYPHNIGWWHEIYTDEINGTEFSVTLCPLTASGIVYPTEQAFGEFVPYVSGQLFNSNLTMWERDAETPTFWNQFMNTGIRGPHQGERLEMMPVVEMTWARWKQLFPDSLVASSDTGYQRNYTQYPYGDFETNDERWVVAPTLPFGDEYGAKDLVLAVDGDTASKAWPFPELDAVSDRVVANDEFEEHPLVIVYDAEHSHAQPFNRQPGERALTFRGESAP